MEGGPPPTTVDTLVTGMPPPTAEERPTPYKGWALQHGGQTPVSPQLKTNSPPSPPSIQIFMFIAVVTAMATCTVSVKKTTS